MSHEQDLLSRFPDLYAGAGVLADVAQVLGAEFEQAEAALVRVMRAHWIATADNEPGGQGARGRGDMDRILSLFLSALGGTSLLRQRNRPSGEAGLDGDRIYRQRMLGLIAMLTSGASTTRGIIEIVAANLGIVGDSLEADAARAAIRIDEFMPAPLTSQRQVALQQEFSLDNPNPEETAVDVRLSFTVPGGIPLTRVTVEHSAGSPGGSSQVVFPGVLKRGETLVLFAGGGGLHEGVAIATEGALSLAPGASQLRVTGQVGFPEVRVEHSLFDFSLFEDQSLEAPTPEQAATFAINVATTVQELHPGSFRLCIPWDIPGYTELLDATNDDARSRIAHIVDQIKAVGVRAEICYEKRLRDQLDMHSAFSGHIERTPTIEDHDQREDNFDMASQQAAREDHYTADGLLLGGAFDYTGFDSLNGFN